MSPVESEQRPLSLRRPPRCRAAQPPTGQEFSAPNINVVLRKNPGASCCLGFPTQGRVSVALGPPAPVHLRSKTPRLRTVAQVTCRKCPMLLLLKAPGCKLGYIISRDFLVSMEMNTYISPISANVGNCSGLFSFPL